MQSYPIPLSRRVFAYACDSFILTFCAILILSGARVLDFDVSPSRILGLLALAICYEPLLVHFRGGTFGHSWANLQIVDAASGKRPTLLQAFARAVCKCFLGAPSVLWKLFSGDQYLWHDYLSRSRVTLRDESEVPLGLRDLKGNVTQEGYLYPSMKRRIVCLIFYWAVVSGAIAYSLWSYNPSNCLQGGTCPDSELIFLICSLLLWVSLLVLSAIQALRGRLWGARRERYKINIQFEGS